MPLCEELTAKGKELVDRLLERSIKMSWCEMVSLEGNLIKALKARATNEKFDKG